jgi:NAD(P)-dependent dehydrogenase (short-subunit alcohol dehydrogenase family)
VEIENSVVLVTGGNRGIGEALVRAFLAAGAAKVYVGARDPANAAHLIAESGGKAQAVRLDVCDQAQIDAAALACPDVSILINNAGCFAMETLLGAPDLSAARAEMETNYFGPLSLCRAFAPILAKHKQSAIANVLSAGGLVAVPGMGGYSPSKFAGRALAACLRAELAAQNTSVTALIVGSVDTRMAAHVQGFKESPATIAAAALKAIRRRADEVDTDFMAIDVRASLARDPKALERAMAKSILGGPVSTGR